LGPLFVVIGAALWGIETFFRVRLNQHFDSEVLVFHEHLFCIAFSLIPFLVMRPSLRHISPRAWFYLILSGALGSAIGTYFFTLSLRFLNPSMVNVLLNFQPVVSVLAASVLLSEKWGRDFLVWAALALVCGLVLALSDYQHDGTFFNWGLLFITLTALIWGFSTVTARGSMLEIPLSVATVGRFAIGAITLLISLLIQGKFTAVLLKWEMIPVDLTDFVLLSLVSGVIPLFFYFKGLQHTTASVGGFCELTQTFSALVITWGVMGNALSFTQVIAGIILLISVYLINQAHTKANPQLNPT
jgi:drug/metabolite transporter (DMT)-like permease